MIKIKLVVATFFCFNLFYFIKEKKFHPIVHLEKNACLLECSL